MKYVIGLDLGTTTIKATVFDERGAFVADSSIERQLILHGENFIEQNANEWVTDSADMIRKAVEKGGISGADVKGISISSQGITVVPVDENGNTLYNAINWMDLRPAKELARLVAIFPKEALAAVTGKGGTSPAYSITKYMWFKNHLPDIYEKAKYFLMPMDFVIMKLTGTYVTDHSMAAGSMCYSLKDRDWSEEILEAADIRRDILPEIRWSGESAGHLLPEMAEMCGLTTDCIVAVGGQDQKVAAHGARIAKDVVTLSLGTCGAFEFLLDQPDKDPSVNLTLCPHVEEGKWVMEGCINTVGGAIKWVRDVICTGLSYDDIDELAESAPVGSHGVLFYPHLAGSGTPHPNAETQTGIYRGLSLQSDRGDLCRALFEGIACECRLNIAEAERVVGHIRQINAFSGGSRASILCQILADVTGCTVRAYRYPEMGNLGAARLAAQAAGLDTEEFGKALLDDYVDYEPGKDKAAYEAVFREYCRRMS